jgi:formamidopyrimidine-DNA glycosylase
VRLRDDPENTLPISALGFDPLLDLPSPTRFAAMLRARSAPVKAVLMDQGFSAGVGNWIADEVLYQAKIDPRRRASDLSEAEAKAIRAKLRHVCAFAVKVNAEKSKFPKSWLFHTRWGRRKDAQCAQGHPIEHITVAGRTTAWVPGVQK